MNTSDRRIRPFLILPLILVLAATATAQVGIEEIRREMNAVVIDYTTNPETIDQHWFASAESGVVNEMIFAAGSGTIAIVQNTNQFIDETGLTLVGSLAIEGSLDVSGVLEYHEASYLILCHFHLDQAATYELLISDVVGGWVGNAFMVDLETQQDLFYLDVAGDLVLTGDLNANQDYVLIVQGTEFGEYTEPYSVTKSLFMNFQVTLEDPVATEAASLTAIKRLFD
jgi:hypothetical protein